jgi:integrase
MGDFRLDRDKASAYAAPVSTKRPGAVVAARGMAHRSCHSMSTPKASRRTRFESGVYTRITKDGKTVFEIGWRDAQGKQRWRIIDGGISAARAALTAEKARRARGEKVTADPRLKFNAAADAWWAARAVRLRPATQNAYSAGLKHLRAEFGNRRMADITVTDVAAFITTQKVSGFKGWTIKGHLTVLGSIFTYSARHLGFVGTNPVSLLDKTERPSTDDEKPKRILTPAELAALLAAVEEPYQLLFDLAAETGVRLGEALGLTWQNVDLDGAAIHITHQLDRDGRLVAPKTARSVRWIEITSALTHKLRTHKLAATYSQPQDFVSSTRIGTPHDHRNVGGRAMRNAVEKAALGPIMRGEEIVAPAPTFHSLRHTHASALIAQGWDIEEVSARLGHADTAITQKIYVHAFDHARRSEDRRRRLECLYANAERLEPAAFSV